MPTAEPTPALVEVADLAKAVHRLADALEVLAVAYVQHHDLYTGDLVDIYEALKSRLFLGRHEE